MARPHRSDAAAPANPDPWEKRYMQPCPAARVRLRTLCITALLSITATAVVASPAAATFRDHDNDGLRNRVELKRWHTNPFKKDSDRDGLADGAEVKKYKTKPRRKDTDGDRLRDGAEVKRWHTNPRKKDTDGDGLSDRAEIKRWHTNPRKKDTDGDGLSDRFEVKRSKTNPRKLDTDGDGSSDGVEVLSGSNPRNRASRPVPKAPTPAPPTGGTQVPSGVPPLPACTTTAASVAAAQSAVSAGGPGTVVCLANGSYGSVSLNANKTGSVTLRAQNPGQATIGGVTLAGRNLRLAAFTINGQVTVSESSSDMIIDRNAITSSSFGVFLYGDGGRIANVLIGANRISGTQAPGENDLIRLHNYSGVRIEGNELRNIKENGGHSDILQSVHGGAGLVIRQNYVHEQDGTQGFFIKDGALTNLTIDNNLIVDDPSGNGYAITFYETSANPSDPFATGYGAVVTNNTVWDDDSGIAIRGSNTTVLFQNNVTTKYLKESGTVTSIGNVIGGNPAFGANYRLPNAGITWDLAAQHYGP